MSDIFVFLEEHGHGAIIIQEIFGLDQSVKNIIKLAKYHGFAIFPDDDSGHEALLDALITTYGDSSIHEMIYSYAPPKDNPTKKYEKFLRKKIGVDDDTPI